MSRGASLKKVCVRRLFPVILPRDVTVDLKLYGNSIFCGFSPLLNTGEARSTCLERFKNCQEFQARLPITWL